MTEEADQILLAYLLDTTRSWNEIPHAEPLIHARSDSFAEHQWNFAWEARSFRNSIHAKSVVPQFMRLGNRRVTSHELRQTGPVADQCREVQPISESREGDNHVNEFSANEDPMIQSLVDQIMSDSINARSGLETLIAQRKSIAMHIRRNSSAAGLNCEMEKPESGESDGLAQRIEKWNVD
jgi:hypothetical protein